MSQFMDSLEDRTLLAAAPRVTELFADNRGQVTLRVDQSLKGNTVHEGSVYLFTKQGRKDVAVKAVVSYDAQNRQITVRAKRALPAGTAYQVKLLSKKIQGADGKALDGEFKASNKPSGNVKAGGDFYVQVKAAKGDPIVRFVTDFGTMDLRLYQSRVPGTVANFLRYANAGRYDNTVIHQNNKNLQIIQGGAFAYGEESPGEIKTYPAVGIEEQPFETSNNVRGTLSAALFYNSFEGKPEPFHTGGWFFNGKDNSAAFDKAVAQNNAGYTVFGKVLNKSGLRVMDAMMGLQTLPEDYLEFFPNNLRMLPVVDLEAMEARETKAIDFDQDLVYVRRVSAQMTVGKPEVAKRRKRAAVMPASSASASPKPAEAKVTFSTTSIVQDAPADVLA